ncbi:hypothetical protein [Streptomyces sp. NPDC008240]|uniref:hypothetical protein n=1 Tax=Streptomyces sp. NPDC008240 TaxID=3364822 RepID=UPI0036EF0CC3
MSNGLPYVPDTRITVLTCAHSSAPLDDGGGDRFASCDVTVGFGGFDAEVRHAFAVAEHVPPYVTPVCQFLRQQRRQGAEDGADHGAEQYGPPGEAGVWLCGQ